MPRVAINETTERYRSSIGFACYREHASLLMPILEGFFHMLPVLTLDLIPEFFEVDGYNQD